MAVICSCGNEKPFSCAPTQPLNTSILRDAELPESHRLPALSPWHHTGNGKLGTAQPAARLTAFLRGPRGDRRKRWKKIAKGEWKWVRQLFRSLKWVMRVRKLGAQLAASAGDGRDPAGMFRTAPYDDIVTTLPLLMSLFG